MLATFTLLLATALVAAGCGGSDRADYEQELAKVGDVVEQALDRLPEDQAEALTAENVRALAEELDDAASELADLDPPKDAASAHKSLHSGLRGVASSFDQLADDLGEARTDSEKARVFVAFATDQGIGRAFEQLGDAQESYARNDYRVFDSTPVAPARPVGDPAAEPAGTTSK